MNVYHTPGVYFERRDITPPVIGLPRTDIAGFAGIAMRGPLFEPVRVESWTQFVSVFGDFIPQGYLAYSVYGFFANGGVTCWISRVADESSARIAKGEFGGLLVSAGSKGSWGNRIKVKPFLQGNEVVALLIRFPDGSEQFIRGPFQASAAPRDNLFDLAQESLNTRLGVGALVSVAVIDDAAPLPKEDFLSGGADGLAELKPEHFEKAFDALDAVTEIGVVAAPDLMPKLKVTPKFKQPPVNCCTSVPSVPKAAPPDDTPLKALMRTLTELVSTSSSPSDDIEFPPAFDDGEMQDLQMALAARAQTLRYRFAVLDAGTERTDPSRAAAWRNVLSESSFAAVYYPWILVDDPLRLTGLVRAIPPSGHVAGVYARSDQRRGVHKPPMNEVLEGVSDVRFRIDDTDHGELNDDNVNAIRVMPGRGVRVMGARTLWRDFLLRYVNVRRLLAMIERALEQSLNWTVFEPNNPSLWAEIDRLVRSFLENLFRLGMLDGSTSEEAYFVKCDEATNPRPETDLGRLICEVGIQPPYPAEFVVVTIGFNKDGIQIREGREQNA